MAFVSQEEFVLFHTIDREVYKILVVKLSREPEESMRILALWLWLERLGFRNLVQRILCLPDTLIDQVADEAITCLNCINNILISEANNDISLLQSLMHEEISLHSLHENRVPAIQGVATVLQDVCVRAFADIMTTKLVETETQSSADHRTLFVTFSKGYPLVEWELREFLSSTYGDCIEAFYMQRVHPNEQALFARIVFHLPSTIDMILKGATKAKFTINGKHVWARKFVPKSSATAL